MSWEFEPTAQLSIEPTIQITEPWYSRRILILGATGAGKSTGYALLRDNKIQHDHPSAPLLYKELVDRISNCQQEKESLRQELIRLITKPDSTLELVINGRLAEVNTDLDKFLGQLVAFGRPPPGFEGTPEQLVSQHLYRDVEGVRAIKEALELALVQPDIDWKHKLSLRSRLRDTEGKISKLSQYLDASGRPRPFVGTFSLDKVLLMLRPKVALMDRVKKEVGFIQKKLIWH